MQQTAVTALRVLDEVARRQPIGVTQLAKEMDMPKSTMQRALRALEASGWIRQSGGGDTGWVLTTKPIDMARRVSADTGLREHAHSAMAALRDRTGESVHLAVREGSDVVIIEVEESPSPVRIHWPAGTRSACHATANGKAMLAYLEPAELDTILGDTLPGFTPATITEKDSLAAELALVRERGYAIAEGELREDIASLAAPILSRTGSPLASLSVFLPIHRMPTDGGLAMGEQVRRAADEVSSKFHI
ncbi:MAG: IclR family transcriptional regulator [Rhodococcus sp. (in: high G+C Gram-positive bacteria)]